MKSKLLAGAAALLLPAFFFSCKNSGNVKPSATGARFELLIVMDDDLWHAPAGQAVFNLFDQDTPGLPQSEPLFKITHVKQADFSDLLKPSRNVLYVDVAADRYTQAKIAYAENYYSYPQCFVRITAPSDSALYDAITTHGDDVAARFIVAERERAMMFNKQDRNEKAVRKMPNGSVRVFDSQKEARRYDELMLLVKAGQVKDLRLQQTFTLQEGYVTGEGEVIRPIVYKADFVYEINFCGDWTKIVEDAKGVQTQEYKLKKKLMHDRFGITIQEV